MAERVQNTWLVLGFRLTESDVEMLHLRLADIRVESIAECLDIGDELFVNAIGEALDEALNSDIGVTTSGYQGTERVVGLVVDVSSGDPDEDLVEDIEPDMYTRLQCQPHMAREYWSGIASAMVWEHANNGSDESLRIASAVRVIREWVEEQTREWKWLRVQDTDY